MGLGPTTSSSTGTRSNQLTLLRYATDGQRLQLMGQLVNDVRNWWYDSKNSVERELLRSVMMSDKLKDMVYNLPVNGSR